MNRYVAFLRGMNLGRRRITNDELCACFAGLGFENVCAFLASGNVIFDADSASESAIEKGLREALDWDVPTFLRTADEVRAIAAHDPFPDSTSAGKLQVAMLRGKPTAAARKKALALATPDDELAIHKRELYWLPRGNLTDSKLDTRGLDAALGAMTNRTRRTLERIAAKFLV